MEQNMYEIWTGFGLVGNTEIQKKMGHKYAKVKYFFKNIPASALKVAYYIISLLQKKELFLFLLNQLCFALLCLLYNDFD